MKEQLAYIARYIRRPAIALRRIDEEEAIPLGVVQDFDQMGGGDPSVPPQFACEKRWSGMYPEV